MFDVGWFELALISIVALLVVGPKELPNLLRTVGHWVGRARSMARHFRSGFDTMVREAEIEEMQKQWSQHNAAIMAATPRIDDDPERAEDEAWHPPVAAPAAAPEDEPAPPGRPPAP